MAIIVQYATFAAIGEAMPPAIPGFVMTYCKVSQNRVGYTTHSILGAAELLLVDRFESKQKSNELLVWVTDPDGIYDSSPLLRISEAQLSSLNEPAGTFSISA